MDTVTPFHNRLDSLIEGIQIIDFDWRYVFLNDVAIAQSKMAKDDLMGFSLLEKNPGIERTPLFLLLEECMVGRKSFRYEHHFIYPDLSNKWFDLSIEPDEQGICILSLDITKHKETERKLLKIKDLYAFLSQVNQNIAHVSDALALYRTSCLLACEFGKFKMAWVGLFDQHHESISIVYQNGLQPEKIPLFNNAPILPNDPQDHVFRTGTPYICNDICNKLEPTNWKPFPDEYDICSCIVLPIRKSGKIIGTFNLYSEKLLSDADEIALLVEVAKDISFALDTFEKARVHQEAEDQIILSEKKFRHTLDNMLEGAQIHDFDWKYIYVNNAAVKFGIYPREALIGHTLMEVYPGIEQTDLFKTLERCMTSRQSEQMETEFVFPNGLKSYFDINIQSIPEGLFILSVDRTEQRKAAEKVLKANRLYAFISAINQSIVHVNNEQALLHNACKIATEIGGFKMAWIGLFEQESKTINLIEHCGISDDEVALFTNASCPENGPQNYVLKNRTHYNCDDIFIDDVFESWRPFATKHGIHSGIVLPIKKGGAIVGTFNLYSPKVNFADEEELALLLEVTGDLSFALDVFEKTRKHNITEALIIANETRFRALIEKSPDMKTLADIDGKVIYGSPAVIKTLGFSPEEFVGKPIAGYIHPDHHAEFVAKRNGILDNPGDSYHFQMRLLHKKGHWVWCEGTVTNMLHEYGVNAFVANFLDVSEKKLAEQQKEFNKTNLRALINNTNDVMWSVDTDFRLITSNRPFDRMMAKMTGKRIEKGDNIFDGAFPEQVKRFKKFYKRAFTGVAFTEIEYGETPVEFSSEISFYPIRKGNEVIGTACFSRDVTAQKSLEKNLLKKMREISDYKYALDESSIVSITNQEGIITHANDNFCRISQYSREELIGQNHSIVNSKFHPQHYMQALWKTIAKGKTWRGEIRNRAKDGSIYWVDATIIPFLDDRQKPYQYIAIRADITQRKYFEEQLLKSERFSREVLDSLSTHIAVINTLGEVVEVNEAWARFGRENNGKTQIIGQRGNYFRVCENAFLSGFTTAAEVLIGMKAVKDKTLHEFYLEYLSPEIERWFALQVKPFEGSQELLVVAHKDISQRRLAEEKVAMNNEELRKTNFELDRFVYSVSHDLRAPLTSVLGLANFIEEDTKEPETREHVRMIKGRINRLDDFIKNILSYSRNNRTGLQVKKIMLQQTITEIVESLRSMKDAEGIRFVIEIDEAKPFYSDVQSLTTIMENLVSNAIKFHTEAESDKYIKITGKSDGGHFIFSIADNGIGIAEKYHDKIFDMFFRLSGKIDGSGIGLYIVKEIIQKLEGSIRVTSETGEGTTFHIQLKNLQHDA